jgi:carboxyl-terminal processing protease
MFKMKIRKLFFIVIVTASCLASCKKDPVTPSTVVTLTPALARDSLYDIMNEWYYWYNLMPTVNKDNYADPYLLMDAMRYKQLDKWSFVADYDQFMAQMQGEFVGHGFAVDTVSGTVRIVTIYSASSLYAAGVRRGWIVKKINGTDVAHVISSGGWTAYQNLLGSQQAGITNTFLFQKPDGTEITIPSTKLSFTVNSVIICDTLHLSSGLTGHLVFDAFIAPSEGELAAAFAYLWINGVQDLILDLRYNGGGYLYIAQILASYIGGNSINGSQFVKLTFNDRHAVDNEVFPFISTIYPASLPRLVVITGPGTASASECLINGLKPYMSVVTIGETTDGKPVGMSTGDIGKKYFIAPITFSIVNKNNEGDYFAGIAPTFQESDDITHDYSDRQESCLKAAIEYLETGSVITSKSSSEFKRHHEFSEKPVWMNNAFLIKK